MTLSDRSKRFEITEATPSAERPRIWIDGRQRPRFDLKAFGTVALGMTRRDLPPHMTEAETRLAGFGRRVADGEVRVRLDWAGKVGRALPSHTRVGGWLLRLARLFADTRALLENRDEDQAELAYPDLVRGRAEPPKAVSRPVATLVASQPARVADEPTLHAIRSAIGSTPHHGQPAPGRTSADAAPQQGVGLSGAVTQSVSPALWRAACRALLGILVAFALPGGAIKAFLYHLDGGDLADWS